MHPDAYWTPRNLTVALLERERFRGVVWEPACGAGKVAEVLNEWRIPVLTSDICDYGFPGTRRQDFLTEPPPWRFDAIVTNPPFTRISQWVKRAVEFEPEKIALLLPATGLGELFNMTGRGFGLSRMVVPSKKPVFEGPAGKTTMNWGCAWFVWTRGFTGQGVIDFVT